MFYFFETKNFPIIVLTIEGGPQSEDELNDFLNAWKNIYVLAMQNEQRYKLLFDVRKANMISFQYLKIMGNWLIKIKELTERWMDRTAIMVKDPGIKLMIQFVFTLYKAQRPFKVFEERELEKSFHWLNSSEAGDPTEEVQNPDQIIAQIEQKTPVIKF
jgi:hypothetical protein